MGGDTVLAILSMLFSLTTLVTVLVLLHRKQLDYASPRDVDEVSDRVTRELARLQYSISKLYRYVEAVDDHTGARGYLVLGRHVPRNDTQA